MRSGGADDAAALETAEPESPLRFPCVFPIKVMGRAAPGFEAAMVAIAREFDPAFDPASLERRMSRGGAYLGLTLTVTAVSRAQLDALYRALTAHPLVKVVL